ncbi:hypothetical protein D9758_015044 [Tetrapyrgos nigripes]|uniref:Uncharacterized protein n=1 Tax=Tetrapyrgos nigripes TaxID=182062 RepID=A0A8H5CTA6_9AGAR|nr:hypothetical protein D9758_015044 [Tetrapyrgos nigripes]
MSSGKTQESFPLTSDDLQILKGWMFSTAIDSLLYGINATLTFAVFYAILLQQNRPSKPQLALLSLLVVMLMITSASLILELAFIIIQIPLNGYNIANIRYVIQQVLHIEIAKPVIERLNYVIGDGIVVWRAWIMFPRDYTVKFALIICGTFADSGLASARVLHGGPAANGHGAQSSALVMCLPLLFTNATATALIGYKAWRHGQDISKNLKDCGKQVSKAHKILILLVESGMLYCGLWIAYLVISLTSSGEQAPSFQTFASAMPILATVYPVLIILVVAFEKSKEDMTSANDMSLSQSIRFASAQVPASQTSESEVESQTQRQVEISVL